MVARGGISKDDRARHRHDNLILPGEVLHGARAFIKQVGIKRAFLQAPHAAQPDILLRLGVLLRGTRLVHQVQLGGIAVQPMFTAHDIPAKIGRKPDKQGRGQRRPHHTPYKPAKSHIVLPPPRTVIIPAGRVDPARPEPHHPFFRMVRPA